MKKKAFFALSFIIIIITGVIVLVNVLSGRNYVAKTQSSVEYTAPWTVATALYANAEGIHVSVDGKIQTNTVSRQCYLNDNLMLMLSQDAAREAFDCAADFYGELTMVLAKGSTTIEATLGESCMYVNGEQVELENQLVYEDGMLYIPLEVLIKGIGYSYTWEPETLLISIVSDNPDVSDIPYYYNNTEKGKISYVKDQGDLGACWAFAALDALESSLLPEEVFDFSEDHMLKNNGFGNDASEGGDYLMALAYLTSWKGPVTEEQDPYNDGQTDSALSAVKHLQEVQILQSKDYDTIKKMIFKYGAVESSVFISLTNRGTMDMTYYNASEYSYCYSGTAAPNHEIVIIGWDDSYPKENFNTGAAEDGAFICRNSWGSSFGDNGTFYVSYSDVNIGTTGIVYTRVDDPGQYDHIYQYDDCGWVARIGYNRNRAYMANVYTADGNETLEAVGFYATEPGTSYQVYVCTDYAGKASLSIGGTVYASGTFDNAGYYTVDLDEGISLSAGEQYAVIVEIDSPGSSKPVAIELNAGDLRTSTVTTAGKESYISAYGYEWENTQSSSNCNVCLKAYTKNSGETEK